MTITGVSWRRRRAARVAGRLSRRRPRAANGRPARSRRGVVYVWVVLIMLAVIGLVGLSLDVAYGTLVAGQLQNAADAASLAAVAKLSASAEDARLAAYIVGGANTAGSSAVELSFNEGNSADGDIVIGRYNRSTHVFTPTLSSPNAVKVVARRTTGALGGSLPLLFAPAFGVDTINLERTAIAMKGGGTGGGMIALNETDKWTFRLSGTVTLSVYDESNPGGDGAVQINSDDPGAIKTDGSPTLLAEEINIYADSVTDPPEFDGVVNTSRPRVTDPLAGIEEPAERDWGADQGSVSVTGGTHYLEPGYYPGGISMTGGTVNLAPGMYVLDGNGLNMTGGNLYGEDVMLYIVGTGYLKLTGNGVVNLAPTAVDSGPYGGILIWQAKGNAATADITGTDQFEGMNGTVYFPSAHVDITGASDTFGIRQLISDTVGISGNGTVTINYDGRNPAPGTKGFLVR